MVDGYVELAQLLKARDNETQYSPILGIITELPTLKIKCGSRVELTADEVKATFDIYETRIIDHETVYVNLNKTVVLLPYSADQKFIAIGVLT